MTAEREREFQRVFIEKLPQLLLKPLSKWTKVEILKAIGLNFNRPPGGLADSWIYFELESKLKGKPLGPYFQLLRKKGRPQKYSKEAYQKQWDSTHCLRQEIATERKVAINKVRYKDVARRMAERALAYLGPQVPDYKIRSLATSYVTHYKALNKKKKSGEI